ncbi:ferritin-like domain-containing protein [Acidobacteria bacterium ACD]|nr:MAG: ferritin-like domain-containing protein [Acidobacteriota bacterium]MCE7957923.1 ferritin-like domain-containing protein [Acidobacteria bacterium ACB2]MDL1950362.1 ferritin-like domain-containing protein [Acidobacteria bacterium ACD]
MSQQPAESAESLNTLLRAELAAVVAYQRALRSLDGRLDDDSEQVVGFAAGHQQSVAALQGCIRTLGGVPAARPGTPWSSFILLRDELSVQQLLDAEECGLADYEASLPSFDGEVRELVELELIPRQRQHVTALSRILIDICGV